MLGNHPITPVLLATDLAAAREFYHGKLGLQIDRDNANAIGLRYRHGTRLDVTQGTVGTADRQTQEACRSATSAPRWPNSAPAASRSKTAALQGRRPKTASPTLASPGPLDHRPSHERPQPQPDACHLTWPELRPDGLRGRRLRCCGSLPGGSPRSCQGHLPAYPRAGYIDSLIGCPACGLGDRGPVMVLAA